MQTVSNIYEILAGGIYYHNDKLAYAGKNNINFH